MFSLTFLENLLKVITSENKAGKTITSTAEKWCMESILASSKQMTASTKQTTEVFQMISNLGEKNLWSPLELLNLLGALINHHHNKGCISIMKILHLMQTYRVSSKWTDKKMQSVISLLETCETEDMIQHLEKSLEDEEIKTIDTLFDEIREMKDIGEETLSKSYEIVSHVTDLIKTGEIKTHSNIKKAKDLSQSMETANLQEVLAVLCNAVNLKIAEGKWWPRINQMISWCLLALSDNGKLLEMGTGEGKSCVIAMFAALRVFRGEKVDVVSSSSVLCQRDAEEWENFYSYFGITVDTNTNKTDDKSRKECYQKDIIYGTIEAFAADHLRQIFEMKDVRPDRRYECIIIDEVDSLLLDQGVQLTYLSSPMVSMEHLNTILAMIWSHVQQYGFLSSGDQTFVQCPPASFFKAIFDSINTEETEIDDPLDILRIAEETNTVPQGFTEDIHKGDKKDIIEKLKTVNQDAMIHFFEEMEDYVPYGFTVYTLNDEGLLNLRKLSPYNTNQIPDLKFLVLDGGLCCPLYNSEEILIKPIAELISKKIQYTPCTDSNDKISIPGFLRNLIETKMSLWVENAFLAIQLKEGRDYVLENNNVCPVDFRSTGIIELNKKWGDGLQQFVEIKHQIKLSTISAVTNYVSNVSFFQKYQGIYGTTGTLGSEKDILFLQDLYPSLSACRMPTFNRKKLYEVQGTLKTTSKEWKSEIKEVVMAEISTNSYREGRAALVICETINKAKEIHKELKNSIPGKIILYCRSDTESLSQIEKVLDPGDVIVATNLAGRGTDIKVSKQVNKNGGLFVILSFLSENTRVELQAFGRTARKGKPGSAQIIMCTEHMQHDFKSAMSVEEAKSIRDRLAAEKINYMMNDISEMDLREDLFSEYCETLHDIYKKTDGDDRKVIVAIMNEFWGIWLQIKSEDIEQQKKSELQKSLREDLSAARQQTSSKLHRVQAFITTSILEICFWMIKIGTMVPGYLKKP
ncbi:LOW QUALITY PROTEIN: protein translocase subunit SecA-like [Fundulus diaphanus]